jgi:hypothetical protein
MATYFTARARFRLDDGTVNEFEWTARTAREAAVGLLTHFTAELVSSVEVSRNG